MVHNCQDIQMGIYERGLDRSKRLPVSFEEWEKEAEKILAAGPFDYVAGAAGAGDTLRANLEAFKQVKIIPRVCRDISNNHGGRQLDGAVATLEVLPSIARKVAGKVPVLMDSGIRRGADIIKDIALGTNAVLIGRPYIYGLAVAGEAGVAEVIEHLIAQTELQLAIAGYSSLESLDDSCLTNVHT